MANSKNLPREMRKGIKRSQRKGLKKLWEGMTSKNRRKFRNLDEKIGVKAFSKSLEPAAEAPAAEAKADA